MTPARWQRAGRAGLALGIGLGCAQIFGIDEACELGVDPGCGAVDPADGTPCGQYCNLMRDKCSTPASYSDLTECRSVCALFPAQNVESDNTNTFECRFDKASSPIRESGDCYQAGIAGGTACGDSCASYCTLMQALCPTFFAGFEPGSTNPVDDMTACGTLCRGDASTQTPGLAVTGRFDASLAGETDPANMATVECRLWHLGVASTVVATMGYDNEHCGHAVGLSFCNTVDGDPRLP